MPRKIEVYAWRVSPALKTSLEEAARAERRSVAELLDQIAGEHLETVRRHAGAESARQHRLHRQAGRFAGRIAGNDPGRAVRARELIRSRLRRVGRAR